jgi:hypothetical protein
MTPLAQMIVNKQIETGKIIYPDLTSADCRCFDVTEVVDLAIQLGGSSWNSSEDDRLFMPSPIVWMEWKTPNGRKAFLVNEMEPQRTWKIDLVFQTPEAIGGCDPIFSMRHPDTGRWHVALPKYQADAYTPKEIEDECWPRCRTSAAFLALINTPSVIGRREHPPHAGLQRKIAHSKGMAGKFPLKPWTEIVLEVNAPREDSQPGTTRMTGAKALHFCRAHLRVKRGKVEFVRSHWRGDPSVGITRASYTVKDGGSRP